ncbi:MAG TPA: DUF6789 family protein [Thermomicrobiaceae bacterium]|nr:DUF6789 family protein [Thermomicrobiaceae bacterium]
MRSTRDDAPKHGVAAGLAGGLAFLGVMALDMRVTGEPTNDLRLLAGLVPGGERHWRWLGTAIHFANSVALGLVFVRARGRLPGPGWLQGLFFAQAENVVVWPLLTAIDRVHPTIRAGRLPRFARPVPFVQEALRHAAYGLVAGAVAAQVAPR